MSKMWIYFEENFVPYHETVKLGRSVTAIQVKLAMPKGLKLVPFFDKVDNKKGLFQYGKIL